MTRFTTAQLEAIASESDDALVCLSFGWSTPLRICTGDRTREHRGSWYEPRGMRISRLPTDPAGLSVTIDNADLGLTTLIYGEGGITGLEVTAAFYLLPSGGDWIQIGDDYVLTVQPRPTWDQGSVTVKLAWTPSRNRAILGVAGDTCMLPHGSPQCGHSGSPCDHTRASCRALGNEARGWFFDEAPVAGQVVSIGTSHVSFQEPQLPPWREGLGAWRNGGSGSRLRRAPTRDFISTTINAVLPRLKPWL
jgi:hypothetical protein